MRDPLMTMRFEARWANGFWRVFDTYTYSTFELALSQGAAIEGALTQNEAYARRSRK